MALPSALVQEGISRVCSNFSTKIQDNLSRDHIAEKLEMALSRLEFVLEMTGKLPITYVSLLRRRKMLESAYIKGMDLLNNHKKLPVMEEGREGTGRVVVKRCSYLQRFVHAATFSLSSLFGFNNEHYLISSVAQEFEWHADCADKFVADVVASGWPLRRDTFFRCPFARQLFEGKHLKYTRTKGSQELLFDIFSVISEGRGIEARLQYKYFDPEKLDKSLDLCMTIRLSESTDIIGIAMNCLRSSASLLNLEAQDAMGELILLSSLQQEISSPYYPRLVLIQKSLVASFARLLRSDPVCCHENVHKPGVDQGIISSDLTHVFLEQVINVHLTCYMPAAEHCSMRGASGEAGRARNVMMMDRPPPLELALCISPHNSSFSFLRECFISRVMGSTEENKSPYGSIEQTIDAARSEAIDWLIRQPEPTNCNVLWRTNHGSARFEVKKQSTDMAAVSKAGGRYNTCSGAKRMRQ